MNTPRIIKLSEADERELQVAATHESGHHAVAAALSLRPSTFIAGLNAGVCMSVFGSPVQKSAVCIAGVMAEDLLDNRRPHRPPLKVKPSLETLSDWHREVFSDPLRNMSSADLSGYNAWPIPNEVCPLAFRILESQTDYLRLFARTLADVFRPRVHAAIVRGNHAADMADVASFVAEYRREANIENARRHIADIPEYVPTPAEFPVDIEIFVDIIIAERNFPVTREVAGRFLRFCEHLRRIGGHADFGNFVFTCEKNWRWYALQFRDWLARQPTEETAP